MLVRNKARNRIVEKAACTLFLKIKRIRKDILVACLHQLKLHEGTIKPKFGKHAEKQLKITPLISPRYSESSERSNILSVSEDSLSET